MERIPSVVPVLPIRNAVIFPATTMPLLVGRSRSLKALEEAGNKENMLLIVTQRVVTPADPHPSELHRVGTLCKVEGTTITDSGGLQIVVTGMARYQVAEYTEMPEGYLISRGGIVQDRESQDPVRHQALLNNLKGISKEILDLLPGTTENLAQLVERIDDASYLTNVCAAYLNLPVQSKQELLETVEIDRRMEILLNFMQKEREVLNLQKEIRDKLSERLNKAQREAILREQMRTIRAELGEEAGEETSDELEAKLRGAALPEEAQKVVDDELKRLRAMPPASAEYHVIRTYLEWIASLPWNTLTQDNLDIMRARTILDEDHFGLENVKKRILQYLAVGRLKNNLHGPILCLIGPPGVGKTSLGQSIARALGRKFIRTSVGGVRDEAEIRGHRRTYVGAMPGRIIQSIKRAGSRNPLMMLDEIDKLRADFHGDPSSAMLEVLDPAQNKTFVDHYLDLPFDLSDVFFIATANIIDTIPEPLKDRMEIIELNGYTPLEKIQIAKRHLLPKQLAEHGLSESRVRIPDETLNRLIHNYTREAGVRELERKIAALLRHSAELIVKALDEKRENEPPAQGPLEIGPEDLLEILGPERFVPESANPTTRAGIATGLAWTPHGGDILFIEATRMPGKGNLILTGQLGDVMKESAQLALSLARSATAGALRYDFDFANTDIHIHVPAGAIPKDGPSAGVAMLCAVASLMQTRVIDSTLGFTGEITLRGAVLPVGGIKEKVLAAHRAGLKTIFLPKRNEKDLRDVPADVKQSLEFVLVENVDDVLTRILGTLKPQPSGISIQRPAAA